MKARLTALAGLFLFTVSAHGAGDPMAEASRHLASGNYRAAVERLRPSAPFAREQVQGRFLYATALAGAGESEKAVELFQALVADFPDKPEPYNNLAALYASQGHLDKAKEVLERAMHTNESYGAIYDNLSSVYVEMARASYAKALRVSESPHTPNLQLLSAMKSAPATPEKPATVLSAAPEAASAEPKPPEQGAAKPEPAKPEAVAQAKPVQTPTPVVAKPLPPAAPSPAQAAVLATLDEWARAWSARDVEGYLGFYATDFDPIGRQTREQWAAERRERLGGAQSISVVLEDAEVQMADPARAVVTLVQGYTAAHYSDRTRKQFTLVKAGDRWLIRSEKSLGIVR